MTDPKTVAFPVKYQAEDRRYLTKRKEFAKSIGRPDLYEYVDHFGLYAGTQTITGKLFVYELLKRSLSIPGHIAEFGTWKGSNLMFMAKVLRALQPNSHKLVLGFDNFDGLPEPAKVDGDFAVESTGKYKGNEAILREAIDLFELDEWIYLIIGDATKTISQFENSYQETLISLAYIDFDLYEPVQCALDFLSRRLSVGGIIAFDEAISRLWPGETIALLEYVNKGKQKFKMESNTLSRQPTMILIRVE
jgi:hypothetical protein